MSPLVVAGALALGLPATALASPTELTGNTPTANAGLGGSVAVNATDTVAIAGAPGGSSNPGSVDVFTKTSGTWSQTAKLTPSGSVAGNYFGQSVAISSDGKTAIVSAPSAKWGTPAGDDGIIYVFTNSGGTWTQTATINSPGTEGNPGLFGDSIAASSDGSTIAVGDRGAGTNYTGGAFVYVKSGLSYVSAGGTLGPAAYGNAGYEVAVSGSGNEVAVGIPDLTTTNFTPTPEVVTLSRSGSSFGYQSTIASPDGQKNDGFGGGALALNSTGTNLLAGVPSVVTYQSKTVTGGAYLLTYSGGSWTSTAPSFFYTAAPSSPSSCELGISGTLSPAGDAILLGDPTCSATGSAGNGVAREWLKSGTTWPANPTTNFSASDSASGDYFAGSGLALPSSAYANPVIGAPSHSVNSLSRAGVVYAW